MGNRAQDAVLVQSSCDQPFVLRAMLSQAHRCARRHFTELCSHYYCLVLEHFLHPKNVPHALSYHSLPTPAPHNQEPTLTLCIYLFCMFPLSGVPLCVSYCV